MVDQVDKEEENNRGRGGGEVKEHDQGDKGPRTRARSKSLSPVLLQWTRGARRRANNNRSNSSRAMARDRGRGPRVAFARVPTM